MESQEDVVHFLAEVNEAAGIDNDEDDEAGDPNDVLDDAGDPEEDAEEAGAPAIRARTEIDKVLAAFRAKSKGAPPSWPQLAGLLKQQRQRAARKASTRVRQRLNLNHTKAVLPRPMHPRVQELRNDLFAEFRKKHGQDSVVQTRGFYYGTFEIPFDGVGDGNTAALLLPVGNDATAATPAAKCFHEAIGDDSKRLGIGHKVNPADTNLQYPGKNLFPSEIFVITHYALEISGVRVKYEDAAINAATMDGAIKNILLGHGSLWDDSQALLPDIFNDYDGRCRLLDAMFTASTLHFTWTKNVSGGNTDTTTLLINALQKVPVTRVPVGESSGGATLIEANDGYVWRLDPNEQTQWGIFNALIRTHESVAFGIKAVKIPGDAATPLVPEKLGLYLRFTVFGDTIRLHRDITTAPERITRRR